jgi:phosphoglycolate phosphatase
MRYQHIIWDWNGTLFNDAWLCLEVINSLLRARNLPVQSLDEYKNLFDFPVIKYYELLGFDLKKEKFETVGAEFIDRYEERRHECKLHDSAENILKSINAHSLSQHVLSAYEQSALNGVIKQYGLSSYFMNLVGHHDIYAPGKIENGRRLVERLNCDKSKILLIGDTVHDYEVAKTIGIESLLVEHGHHSFERLKKCNAPIVQSLQEAVDWFM